MNQTEKIKTAFERQTKVVMLREGMGIGTAVTKATVKDGLTCEITEGDWKLVVDMPEKWGGNNQGPNPGMFGRGALGSCITIGYLRWAAKMGVQIDELEVEVHADYNTRGELGVGGVNPGYSKIRYIVNIVSPSPEEDIINMMDTADKYSSYIDHFVRPIDLEREVKLNVGKDINMKPELQRRVQRYGWDKASEYYENCWAEQLKPAQDLLIEMANINNGEKVIDIACGTGLVSFIAAAKVGPDGFVLGTDISDKMVQAAQNISRSKNLQNINFQRMDAEELTSLDNQFDVSLSALCLMYYPDPLKACEEIKRVTKSGGRSAAVVWGERKNCGWAEIFPIVDSRVETDVCPMFYQLGTKDNLEFTFEQAGFEDVKLERISTKLFYQNSEDAYKAVFAGGPVALAYARFDEKTKEEAHAEYIESIKDFRTDDHYEIPSEFVVAIGNN